MKDRNRENKDGIVFSAMNFWEMKNVTMIKNYQYLNDYKIYWFLKISLYKALLNISLLKIQ